MAMLTGADVSKVIAEFHEDFQAELIKPYHYLVAAGLQVVRYYADAPISRKGIYLLSVPSLNIDGMLHHVLLDFRADEPLLLDPAKGYGASRYYTLDDVPAHTTVKLRSYVTDLLVLGW